METRSVSMGTLTDILETLMKNADPQAGERQQVGALLQPLLGWVANQGLESLVGMLEQKGLGPQVRSWVSSGPNLPIGQTELEQGWGTEQVEQLARQAGVPRQSASPWLSRLLPVIIGSPDP
jgi:uncharacterized protein YidB (DUF937 family)